jgi:hypothetical protein
MWVVLSITYMKKTTYQVIILQLKQKWNMKFAVGTLIKDDWQTRWSLILETEKIAQLLEKFSAFHNTLRFITVFTAAHHQSLSWATPSYEGYTESKDTKSRKYL